MLVGPSLEQIEEALIPILGEPARFADGLVVFGLNPLPEQAAQARKAGGASREE